MTTLEKFMQEHSITAYALTKKMGMDTGSAASYIKRRVTGEEPLKKETLEKMLTALSELSGKPITMHDLTVDPLVMKIT